MLTIDLNGTHFALDTSFSIRVQGVNPACYMDKLPGDVGMGISIPVNDINRGILGAPEMFAKYYPNGEPGVRFAGCSIRFGGALLLSGSLVVTQATTDSYECWLQSNLGVMGEDLQSKTLHDLAWPTNKVFNDKGFSFYDDETDDYGTMLLYNPGFWEGMGREAEIPVIYTDENNVTQTKQESRTILKQQHYINYSWFVNSYNQPAILDGCVVSPYMFLRYAITESLRLNKWFIGRNDMLSNPNIKNVKIYNNFNIVDFTITEVETVKEDRDIPSWDDDEQAIIVRETSKTITAFGWAIRNFDYKQMLPKISYKDFLIGLQNSLNYIFKFRSDGKVDIIDRNEILSGTAIDLHEYHVGHWVIGERKKATLKFVQEIDKDDKRMGSDFEDLTARISDFKEPVATYADLLALPSPDNGELRMVKSMNSVFEYRWKVVSSTNESLEDIQYDAFGWAFASSGPQPYIFPKSAPRDNAIEEINSTVSEMQRTPEGWVNSPAAWQQGNLGSLKSLWNNFTFRLLPRDIINYSESLWWDNANGLFETRWRKWAQFWATRKTVEAEFQLPLNVLVYISENITSKFRTDEGEFIIEEMETEFGLNEIGKTRIKGYKV